MALRTSTAMITPLMEASGSTRHCHHPFSKTHATFMPPELLLGSSWVERRSGPLALCFSTYTLTLEMPSTLYELLGVPFDASPEQIKSAYRARMKLLHPDRVDRLAQPEVWDAANVMLGDLNRAYKTLSDARTRHAYDESLRTTSPDSSTCRPNRGPAAAAPAPPWCPRCGWSHGWDGSACTHCSYPHADHRVPSPSPIALEADARAVGVGAVVGVAGLVAGGPQLWPFALGLAVVIGVIYRRSVR